MSLRPLNDRVLIKPHENPNQTESGLILPERRSDTSLEMQGTVVAVGRMSHPRKAEAQEMLKWLERNVVRNPQGSTEQVAELLSDLVRREPIVQPGDDVLFSWTSGQEITVDDERYLLMREDDLLAVLEPA